MEINILNVPEWLKITDIFLTYIKNNNSFDNIVIPKNCLRQTNTDIIDLEDFINLYETAKYWNSEIPISFEEFCLKSENNKNNVLGFLYSKKK